MSPQQDTTKKFLKDARTTTERVQALEEMIPMLIQTIGKQFDEIKPQLKKLEMFEELMDVTIGLLGTERFAETLKASRLERAQNEAEAAKKENEKLKADGILQPVEKVETDSVVVISSHVTETGAPVGAGWVRFRMAELKPELQQKLLGQSVGFTDQEGPNTFTLLEILKVNRDVLKQLQQSEAQPAGQQQ